MVVELSKWIWIVKHEGLFRTTLGSPELITLEHNPKETKKKKRKNPPVILSSSSSQTFSSLLHATTSIWETSSSISRRSRSKRLRCRCRPCLPLCLRPRHRIKTPNRLSPLWGRCQRLSSYSLGLLTLPTTVPQPPLSSSSSSSSINPKKRRVGVFEVERVAVVGKGLKPLASI